MTGRVRHIVSRVYHRLHHIGNQWKAPLLRLAKSYTDFRLRHGNLDTNLAGIAADMKYSFYINGRLPSDDEFIEMCQRNTEAVHTLRNSQIGNIQICNLPTTIPLTSMGSIEFFRMINSSFVNSFDSDGFVTISLN